MPRGNENTISTTTNYVKTNFGEGKFFIEVPEGTEGAVEHVIKKGKREGQTVFREYFNSFSGKFEGINMELIDFGNGAKEWQFMINLNDGQEIYSYSISAKDYNGRILALQAMTLEAGQDVSAYIFVGKPDAAGKTRTIIRLKDIATNKTLSQGFWDESAGKSLAPAPKKDKMTQEFSFSEVLTFFNDEVIPKCHLLVIEKKEESEGVESVSQSTSDDLPF